MIPSTPNTKNTEGQPSRKSESHKIPPRKNAMIAPVSTPAVAIATIRLLPSLGDQFRSKTNKGGYMTPCDKPKQTRTTMTREKLVIAARGVSKVNTVDSNSPAPPTNFPPYLSTNTPAGMFGGTYP